MFRLNERFEVHDSEVRLRDGYVEAADGIGAAGDVGEVNRLTAKKRVDKQLLLCDGKTRRVAAEMRSFDPPRASFVFQILVA